MFRRLVTGTLALLFTVGVIGGAPVLLLRVAGNPLPKRVPSLDEITQLLMSPDNGSLFLRVLTWVGWLAWATFTISVLIEIPAALRGRRAKRIRGLSAQQKVAGALVGAIFAIFVGSSVAHAGVAAPVVKPVPVMALATNGLPSPSVQEWEAPLTTMRAAAQIKPGQLETVPPDTFVPAAPAHLTPAAQAAASPAQHGIAAVFHGARKAIAEEAPPAPVIRVAANNGAVTRGQQVQAGEMVYVVRKGDWLGRIAQRFTGDFECYNDLVKLNPNLVKNPHHIEPGWRLVLPAGAKDRGIMSHATGAVIMPQTQVPQSPPKVEQPPAPPPKVEQPPPKVQQPAPQTPTPAPQTPTPAPAPASNVDTTEETGGDGRKVPATLAAGAGLAAASVLAAHVIVHRRQLKQTQIRVRRRKRVTKVFLPTVENAVRQMAKHRAVDRLDAGLRSLAIGLRGRSAPDMPDIAAVWQAGGDIAVILTSPCGDPPEPYEERWQNTWSLSAHAPLPESSFAPALLPGLLTFATWPQGGDLLVDTERTGLLTITGDPENCANLLRSLAAEAASAQWTDSASVLLAGLDPIDMNYISALNSSRVRTAGSIPEALARISKRAAANASILHETQAPDTMSARINNSIEGFWATHVLFIADPWGEHSQQLRELDAQLAGLRRVGVAVVATHPTATRWSATVSSDQSLHMAWLAVAGANARQLSTEELAAQVEAGI